jgi:hypothetical protein
MKNEVKIHEVSSSPLKGRREFLKLSGMAVAGTGLFWLDVAMMKKSIQMILLTAQLKGK